MWFFARALTWCEFRHIKVEQEHFKLVQDITTPPTATMASTKTILRVAIRASSSAISRTTIASRGPINQHTSRRAIATRLQPSLLAGQRRWYSAPKDSDNKLYDFETVTMTFHPTTDTIDIDKCQIKSLIASPSPDKILIGMPLRTPHTSSKPPN
jgi:hypothetical protein